MSMFFSVPSERLSVIAAAIMRLSDFYIQNPEGETPWNENFCQLAYRYYFLPLNLIRNQKVIQRGQQVGFFKGLTQFIDWGCGPGTASLALAKAGLEIKKQILFDHSTSVLREFSDLHSRLIQPESHGRLDLNQISNQNRSALVFSYSFTELKELPNGWDQFEALMILEPSTSEDGRRLMELRTKLISQGYHIWAPCTHHLPCPLLTQSKHDWCHDRASVEAPEWFLELEQLLPMKNRTVTVSYLLARKTPPPEFIKTKGRLTGDSLEEKGKTRQLICRNDQREFLTWMHKSLKPQTLPRGELMDLPADYEVKSNELRLKSPLP